jgi:hypothetical protein
MLRRLRQISCTYRGPDESYCGLSLKKGHAEWVLAQQDIRKFAFAVPLCMVVPAASSLAAVPVAPVTFASQAAGFSLPVFDTNCTGPLTPQAGPHSFFGSSGFHESQIH